METQKDTVITRTARPLAYRRWLAGLGALLAVGAASFSIAQAQAPAGAGDPPAVMGGFGGGGEGWRAARMQRLLDKVGATDSQKGQIKAIWDGLRPQLKTLHQQGFQLRQQIGQAITAPNIDQGAVEKLRQQSVQLMDKTSALVTQGMVSSAQVLTPDQRKQALTIIQEHRRHHGPGAPAGN
jgi:Spy/CpxP family protein refolding chaperone